MSKKTFYAFIISFILLIAVIILNRISFEKMKYDTRWVNHTREVITGFENISNHFKSAEIYTPSYLTIPESEFYLLYKKDADSLSQELVQVRNLVKDNQDQLKMVDS